MPQPRKVAVLPSGVKAWLDAELVRRGFSDYVELAELLGERGYRISKSALGSYGKSLKEEQEDLKQSIEMAKAFAEVVGDDGAAMNQTLVALAQQELMKVVREARYETEGMKFTSVINAIARLSRADISTKRYVEEVRAKARAVAKKADRMTRQGGLSKERRDELRELITSIAS